MYHVENVIRETGNPVNDGLMSVYVNTEVADDSLISDLMQCFLKIDFRDDKFPNISRRMKELKHGEEDEKMCKSVEEYAERKAKEAAKEAAQKAAKKATEEAVKKAGILQEKTKAEYPFLIPDTTMMNGRLQGISAFPETFFVDKDGNIVGDTYTGSHTLDEWKEIVEKELKNVSK